MPAYVWITALALVALVALVVLARGWWRVKWVLDWLLVLSVPRWWYSWRHAAHVIEQTAAEYGPPGWYGSMILAEEQHHEDWLPAPADPAPWLAQTRAELSPEALGAEPMWEYRSDDPGKLPGRVFLPRLDDPGPGVPPSSLTVAPGPVTDLDGGAGDRGRKPLSADAAAVQPSRWLAEQLAVTFAWSEWQQQKAAILA